jgi:hypothetical protein
MKVCLWRWLERPTSHEQLVIFDDRRGWDPFGCRVGGPGRWESRHVGGCCGSGAARWSRSQERHDDWGVACGGRGLASSGPSRVWIRSLCRGENLPGLPGAGGGDACGRRFLFEDAAAAYSTYLVAPGENPDPLRLGGGGTLGCRILPEGAALEPNVCHSVAGCVLAVLLPEGGVCIG